MKCGRWLRRMPVAVLVLVATGCGGGTGGGDDSGGGTPATKQGEVRDGGSVTAAFSSQPDYLDPALSYSVAGREAVWLAYTPLLTYAHAEGAAGGKLIPGLADGLPKVSDGGRTYTLTLRKGVKYSDGSEVKASDVEHAIQRVLTLGSGGAPFFEVIEGAKEYEKAKKPGSDISGITADDASGEITFKLTQARGDFGYILAFPFAAPVPASTPFKDQSKTPPPGVGSYTIGDVTPNRQFVMTRNKDFELPGIPKGHLDRITVKIMPNVRQETQQVLANQIDYMDDTPPADLLPQVKAKAKERFRTQDALSTYFFFLNMKEKPFSDAKARAAVNYALDRRAFVRLFGGLFKAGCSFIPAGMPGHPETPCPYGDPGQPPDMDKAKQLVKESGQAGAQVTVWGNTDSPTDKITQYYADVLNKIGFKAKPKLIDPGVYLSTVGNQKTRAQTGMSDWYGDYLHPVNFMQLLNGAAITQTNNKNYSNVDDPELNRQIDELNRNADLDATADKWAELDEYAIGPDHAYTAPFGQTVASIFMSERMNFEDCATFHTLFQSDFSSWCLK